MSLKKILFTPLLYSYILIRISVPCEWSTTSKDKFGIYLRNSLLVEIVTLAPSTGTTLLHEKCVYYIQEMYSNYGMYKSYLKIIETSSFK